MNKCTNCHLEGEDLPGIKFNFLQNEPFICESCVFHTLCTSLKEVVPWKKEIHNFIKK